VTPSGEQGTPDPEQGPSTSADQQHVEQATGSGSGLPEGGGGGGDSGVREVGVTAAVERGPAELSSEGDPVPDNPHIALEGREPARSTDELPTGSQG
jgi:hypothetical protein